jgi:hypothetical protein
MKNFLVILFLSIFLVSSAGVTAQEGHHHCCTKSEKKCCKSYVKESKIRKKMFHDHRRMAQRKYNKAWKKEHKSEWKEYAHHHNHGHDDAYWW